MSSRPFFALGNPWLYPWLLVVGLGLRQAALLLEQAVHHGGVYAAGIGALNLLLLLPVAWLFGWLVPLRRAGVGGTAAPILWGAFGATLLSAFLNVQLVRLSEGLLAPDLRPLVIAPLVEEGAKLLGILLLLVATRRQHWGIYDGIRAGALVGIGFVAVENLAYYLSAHHEIGGEVISDGVEGAVLRSWAALAGSHVVRTAILGGFVVYGAIAPGGKPRRILVALLGVVLAVGLHALWNSPFGIAWDPLLYVLRNLPGVLVLLLVVHRAARHETARLSGHLRLLPAGVLEARDVEELVGPYRRLISALERLFMDAPERRATALRREAHLALLEELEEGDDRELLAARIATVRAVTPAGAGQRRGR